MGSAEDGSISSSSSWPIPANRGIASRVLLVDGHAYAYRSFYAISELRSPRGEPTNGLFGFIRAVSALVAEITPGRAAVVWDGGLSRERLALLPQYKAQRPPMPPTLEVQLPSMVDWLNAVGIGSLCYEGIEADDWIAAIAVREARHGHQVVIASSDKDFLQLVSPNIGIRVPSEKGGRIWGDAEVRAKTGVSPGQIVDWLCLIGDAVDNIPGIPGIGPKTATRLLQEFQSCGGLIERLEEVKSARIRDALRSKAHVVWRNAEVIRLKTDLPVPTDLDQLRVRPPNTGQLAKLYGHWGFRSLLAGLGHALDPQRSLGL